MSESSLSIWISIASLLLACKLIRVYVRHSEKKDQELNRLYRQRAKDAALQRKQISPPAPPQQTKDKNNLSTVKKRKVATKKNSLSRAKKPEVRPKPERTTKQEPKATFKRAPERSPTSPSPSPSPSLPSSNVASVPPFCQPVARQPASRPPRNALVNGLNPWEPQHRNVVDALAA